DEASRRVIDLLQAADFGVWIGIEGDELPPTSWFVLSPRLEGRRALDSRKAGGKWIEEFVMSRGFDRYLDHGELPAAPSNGTIAHLGEPLRSYIAAVALFGGRGPVALVIHFFYKLMSTRRRADLLRVGAA